MSSISATSAASPASAAVHSAIRNAAERTEVDFDFLMAQARIESGLNPNARAGTSSATGLFQFIDRTWLGTVQKHGAEHGLGWAADAIETIGGRPTVRDPAMRGQIMQLRNDPQAASLMAGEYASDNAAMLSQQFGRAPDGTELYLAHFLGPAGAARFIAAHDADPSRAAAPLFAGPAASNRPIFYDHGRARSLAEVRDLFTAKLERAVGTASGPVVLASAPDTPSAEWHAAANAAANYGANADSNFGASPRSYSASSAGAPANRRAPMAEILRSSFGEGSGLSNRASTHVAKAYGIIERFGL